MGLGGKTPGERDRDSRGASLAAPSWDPAAPQPRGWLGWRGCFVLSVGMILISTSNQRHKTHHEIKAVIRGGDNYGEGEK